MKLIKIDKKNVIKDIEPIFIIFLIFFILLGSALLFGLDYFNISFKNITSKYDWLSYISGIFAAVATLWLGYISVKQNYTLKKINEDIRDENLKINSNFNFNVDNNLYFMRDIIDSYSFRLKSNYYVEKGIVADKIVHIGFTLKYKNGCNIISYHIKKIRIHIVNYDTSSNGMDLVAVDNEFILINQSWWNKSDEISSFINATFWIKNSDLEIIENSKIFDIEFECCFKNNLDIINTKSIRFSTKNDNKIKFSDTSEKISNTNLPNFIDKGLKSNNHLYNDKESYDNFFFNNK